MESKFLEISIRKQVLESVLQEFKEKEEILRIKHEKIKELADLEDESCTKIILKKMQQEHPLYAVGTSLYNDKLQSKYPQPFRKKTQFSKPIEEHYDTAFKQE